MPRDAGEMPKPKMGFDGVSVEYRKAERSVPITDSRIDIDTADLRDAQLMRFNVVAYAVLRLSEALLSI
jgi:hypothetical protein